MSFHRDRICHNVLMLQIIPRISLWTEDLKFSTDANLLSDTMEQDEEILAYRLSIQSQKILFLK